MLLKKIITINLGLLFLSLVASAALEIVESPRQIMGGAYSYNFGHQFIMSRSSVDYTIRNSGPDSLNFQKMIIYGIDFEAVTNCPVVLEDQKRCTVRISFQPWNEGWKIGDLYMYFKEDSIRWSLSGLGIK